MTDISQWNTSAASNNSAPPDGFPEGQSPSSLNDSNRELMAAVKRWYEDTEGSLVTGGSGNTYTLTTNTTHAALADIGLIVFKVDRANTGSATLNVDGLGAKTIEFRSVALISGDLAQNATYAATYNATSNSFDLIGSGLTDWTGARHDGFSDFVADEHVAHTGVSVLNASNPGLVASNNDLSSDIGLAFDTSSLTAKTATEPVDLDVDLVAGDDGGVNRAITCASLLTPELGTEITGTTNTLSEADFGKLTRYSSTSNVTITLPAGLKTGFWTVIQKSGAGPGYVRLSTPGALQTPNIATDVVTQYEAITVFHLGSTVWTAWGGIV